jgi:hypothetical protein
LHEKHKGELMGVIEDKSGKPMQIWHCPICNSYWSEELPDALPHATS